MARQDIHKPSAINPEDYEFVAVVCPPESIEHIPGGVGLLESNYEILRAHKAKTGGRESTHEHGGTCHCCGASAIYLGIYYHESTNTYIKLGERCSSKLEGGDRTDFRQLREGIRSAKDFQTGKQRAKRLLEELELVEAWKIYEQDQYLTQEHQTIADMISKMVKYGDLTEKQVSFVRALLNKINNPVPATCPEGRQEVVGTVKSLKTIRGMYGVEIKMLVQTENYKVYGTVPTSLKNVEVGNSVKFLATVTPKEGDFGFFKRPTKGAIL